MAITVSRLTGGRADGQVTNEGIVVNYTANYQVLSTGAEIGKKTAINAVFSQVPVTWLSQYQFGALESDPFAYMIDVQTTEVSEDGRRWVVSLGYSNKLPFDPVEITTNPLQRPAKIQFFTNLVRKTFRRDKNGVPVIDSAKQPFDPLPSYDEARPGFRITKNKAFELTANTHKSHVGTTNNAGYNGFETNELRCTSGESDGPQIENGVTFWVWSFTFEYAPLESFRVHENGVANVRGVSGWDTQVLDAGYKQYNAAAPTKLISCKDNDEQDATEPMPLKEDGTQIPVPITDQTQIGYKVFRTFDESDFDSIGLLP